MGASYKDRTSAPALTKLRAGPNEKRPAKKNGLYHI